MRVKLAFCHRRRQSDSSHYRLEVGPADSRAIEGKRVSILADQGPGAQVSILLIVKVKTVAGEVKSF